jgi:hypothetical protein
MKQPEIHSRIWKRWFGVQTLFLTLGLSTTLHGAQAVTLAWDPSPGPGVVGYKIHYGEASATYTQVLDAGNGTNAVVSALLEGHTYFLAVCAYNSSAIESDPSNEIQYTIPTLGNSPPIANNSSLQGNEDQTVAALLSASDPDGNPLTYAVVTSPAHGSLSGTAPTLTYRPQTNYSGPDSFTFRVNDGTTNSGIATISLTVTAVNDPPVASNGSATTVEDAAVNVVLNGSDPEGSALTYAIVASPTHGALSGTAPTLTYRPQTNYSGPDSFTFRVNDGTTNSAPATVSITVTAANDAPVASGNSVITPKNTAATVVLAASDVDGDALAYSVVASPAHGTLGGTPPNLTYVPQTNYSGPDSFTFKVNDGTVDSAVATISITVTSVNSPPVATNGFVTTAEDGVVNVVLSGSDADGGPLTYSIASAPTRGSLSGVAPNLTYRPNTNYNGTDSFTFQVNDGTTNSATATVSITVTAVNDAPVALAGSLTTSKNTPASITLSGSDVEGSALTHTIVSNPTHGSLSGQAPNLTYQPNANYTGSDSFTTKVNDGSLDSALATVLIDIKPGNRQPKAKSGSATTAVGTLAAITLSATDDDGDALVYTIINAPTNGVLSGEAPNLAYTPQTNYIGPDSLSFIVNDGSTNSDPATVSITVTALNTAPTISGVPGQVTTQNVGTAAIPFVVGDAQSASSSLTLSGASSNPSLVPVANVVLAGSDANRTVAVTPALDQTGSATITVTVSDGSLNASQSFVVTVNAAVSVTPFFLTLEAEAAALVSPMTIASDSNASGGLCIASTVSDTGLATFSIDIPAAGDYVVWCRVLSPTNWFDSFYVSADGGTEYVYATAQDRWTNAWQWSALVMDAGPAPRVFQFAVGNHTVVFRGREPGTALDQIVITNDRGFVPNGGSDVTVPNTRISSIAMGPVGVATITWGATAGKTYRVFYKSSLLDPTWQVLGADVLATGTNALKQDYITGNRFYGVAVLP